MDSWANLLTKLSSNREDLSLKLKNWRLDSTDCCLTIIQGYQYIAANTAALSYFKTQSDYFLYATPYDFSPRIQSSGQNSIDYAKQKIDEASEGKIVQFNWLHLNSKGVELPTSITLYPFQLNNSLVLLAELTPYNRRSKQRVKTKNGFIKLPKDLLSMTLEDSAEAIYISDEQHKIIAVNKAMCRICGYSTEQLIEKGVSLFEVSNAKETQEYHSTLLERGIWQGEVSKKRSDGTIFTAWKSCRRIVTENKNYYITLFSDISSKKKLEAKLTEQAMFDTLTGLPNRFHLKQILSQALSNIQRKPDSIGALMFLDLNGFKNINDYFGHATGDKVLQLVSARLEASCIDKADIARLGGDEFTLVIQDCHNRDEVKEYAQEIMSLFEAPFEIDDQKFYLGTSIGISLFPEHSMQVDKLISLADTAMYSAKQSPDHLRFYNNSMYEAAEQKLTTLNELKHAQNLKQFQLAYQAIVDLEDNSVIGVEALLRWHKSDGKIVDATEFVPLLEKSGLLFSIGRWILTQACKQVANWRIDYQLPLKACINISPMQLTHPDFLMQVKESLAESKLPAEAIIFEITESTLLLQPHLVNETLNQLKHLGINIAIDNFGAGLSPLSQLGELPIDILKIDAVFAHQLDEPQGKQLCQAMIQLAQSLNFNFVIKGIESKQQKQTIQKMGKGYGQGHLFGHPTTADNFSLTSLSKLK